MRDKELYAQILGVRAPWSVSEVDLRLQADEVHVYVERDEGAGLVCPKCGEAAAGYDHRQRRWRHLDTCQFKTIVVADIPRVRCLEHGVVTVEVPWAESGSPFTALFEALVIDWLKEASTAAVSRRLRLSWNSVDAIMRRAVARGLERRARRSVQQLGVDETSFQRRHEYVTVVSDQGSGDVLYVADGRKQTALEGFYEGLNKRQLGAIRSVAMDMWPAYIQATRAYVANADEKICFDKFHVAKHLGDGIDQVRRVENKELRRTGDGRLKRTRYTWLRNPLHMSRSVWRSFEELRESALKTARAWAIREAVMSLWDYRSRTWAEKAWRRALGWMARCRLDPMVKVGRTLRTHLWGIVNAVIQQVDNGRAESINSRIQKLKARSHGFRNRERFRTVIYFHLGGLSLYPKTLCM